ncbi:hypothetical protein [Candidatus Uabimicrobium sp. HlEnr_7]|uniref:hypothetical protein n=1 Tax=Candidatus Uabimicrobium helgolandensis TaxID=3095367 RepID=UPI0035590042
MRILIFLVLISTFTWSQLVEEKYEEKQIDILLEQDSDLQGKVNNIWQLLSSEEQSQKAFFQNINKKIKELLAYNLKYKMKYQELLRRYNLSTNELKKQQHLISQLTNQTSDLQKNLNNTENLYRQSQQNNASLIAEVSKLREQIAMYKTKYNDSNQRCEQTKRDNEDLIAIVDKLRNEKQNLEQELNRLKNLYANEQKNYTQQLNEANNRYNSQTQSYKDLQQQRDNLLKKNKLLSETIEQLRKQLQQKQQTTNYQHQRGYVVTGKANIRRGAIARAWRKAMLKSLQKNYDRNDFEAHHSEIEQHLYKNWRDYTVGSIDNPAVVKKFDGRKITIRVEVKEDKLLKDIRYLFDQTRSKLKGMHVALVAERNSYHNQQDVMFDTLQDKLGQDMTVRDLRAIDNLMKKEAQMLGLSAGADPAGYVARKFNQVNIVIYMDVKTQIQRDPYAGEMVYATLRCRGVWQQTAQELWHFQVVSGKKAKPVAVQYLGRKAAQQRAIKNTALVAYKKIRSQIRSRKTVLPKNVYELKFVNLGKNKRRVIDAIADMKFGRRPAMKILPGSQGAGKDYFSFRVKWLLTRESIDDIIARIEETCEDNEVSVESKIYSKGVIIFEPANFDEYDDDF